MEAPKRSEPAICCGGVCRGSPKPLLIASRRASSHESADWLYGEACRFSCSGNSGRADWPAHPERYACGLPGHFQLLHPGQALKSAAKPCQIGLLRRAGRQIDTNGQLAKLEARGTSRSDNNSPLGRCPNTQNCCARQFSYVGLLDTVQLSNSVEQPVQVGIGRHTADDVAAGLGR